MLIYPIYLVIAAAIIYLSNKASFYVDQIDKKTSLSGAFIGGVMLSAVTSLPELFTSISSTLFLSKPGLAIGNILGSNIFNMAVLALLMVIFLKPYSKVKVAKSHIIVTLIVAIIYLAVVLNLFNLINFEIFTVNITSLIIIALYIIAVRYMSNDDGGGENIDDNSCDLSVKQIGIRFALTGVGIIILSIAITYVTDNIATRLNLGTGLAGALFLGIATSLPEVSSTIALFKIKNYNIAIGNIIGSNIFNLLILAITDVIYIGKGVYDYSDPKTINLLIFGTVAVILLLLTMKFKNKVVQVIGSGLIVATYVFALAI